MFCDELGLGMWALNQPYKGTEAFPDRGTDTKVQTRTEQLNITKTCIAY